MKTKQILMMPLAIVVAISMNIGIVHAQVTFDLHTGFTAPIGDFKETSTSYESYMADSKFGNAALGINVGMQLVKPLSKLGFGIYASADVFHNAISKKQRNGYDDDLFDDLDSPDFRIGEFKSKHSRYFNIPISIGLHYQRSTSDEKISWYGSIGPTINYFNITDYHYEFDAVWIASGNQKIDVGRRRERIYSSSVNVGFKLDVGFLFSEKWIVGVQYLSLGTHEYEFYEERYNKYDDGEWEQPTTDPQVFNGAQKISMLQLKLGMRI